MGVGNCLNYNEKETIFFRAGTKMRDMGGSIIRQARRQAEMLGFDRETGLMDEKVGKKEEVSDNNLTKEIDEFLNDENRESLDDDEHVKQLLILNDKANLIHHGSAKSRRQQKIKLELQKLRRKVSIEKINEKIARKERSEDMEDVVDVKKKTGKSKVKNIDGKKRKL